MWGEFAAFSNYLPFGSYLGNGWPDIYGLWLERHVRKLATIYVFNHFIYLLPVLIGSHLKEEKIFQKNRTHLVTHGEVVIDASGFHEEDFPMAKHLKNKKIIIRYVALSWE